VSLFCKKAETKKKGGYALSYWDGETHPVTTKLRKRGGRDIKEGERERERDGGTRGNDTVDGVIHPRTLG